ncbi:MAG TPA: ubiquinol-cytochrome c reductase iron-sulfur subunit [Dissulfurispiraceae bacterium]
MDTRRGFLKGLIKGGVSFLFLIFGYTFLEFLYPAKIKKRELRFFYAMSEDELPKLGVKKVEITYERNQRTTAFRAFVVNHERGPFALSPVCSHLGCLVEWSRPKNRFICPCHGGQYDIEGKVIGGPPPLPLTRMPLKVEGGKVYLGIKV